MSLASKVAAFGFVVQVSEGGGVNVPFLFEFLKESSLDANLSHPGFFLGQSGMGASFSATRSFLQAFSFLILVGAAARAVGRARNVCVLRPAVINAPQAAW